MQDKKVSSKDERERWKKERERAKEGRTHEQDVVILRFSSEVLEDALFPEPFHVIPVVDQSMLDRVVERVGSEERK